MSLNVYLNSKDRVFGTSSAFEFQTNLNNILSAANFSAKLEDFSMPFLEYGINSKNSTLVFQENAVDTNLTATISNYGTYDVTTFMATLKAALEAAGANTYTVTYNTTTKKITISADGINTFKIISGSMLDVIGYQAGSFATSHVASNPINIAGSTYIDIYSNLVTPNYSVGIKPAGSLLCRVNIENAYGTMISYNGSDTEYFEVFNDDALNNIAFQLFDDKGRELEIPDNCNSSIVLSLKYSLN